MTEDSRHGESGDAYRELERETAALFTEDGGIDEERVEEFRDHVNRAFPEDDLTIDELVDLAPDERYGAGDPGDGGEQAAADPETFPDDPVGALVETLAERDLTDAERAVVRETLGLDARRSTEVRVRYLQSRMTDLETYVDALEAFIDDSGTANEVLRDVEERTGTLEERVESLATAVDELETVRDDFRQRIETTDSRVGALEEETRERLDAIEADLAVLDEEFSAAVADVEARLDRLERRQQVLCDVFVQTGQYLADD